MSCARILTVGLLIICPALLAGAEGEPRARIELRQRGGTHTPVLAVVTVTPDGTEELGSRVESQAPGALEVPLPGKPPWTVRVVAPGLWSAPVEVRSEVESIRVDLWPESQVRAQLRMPAEIRPPSIISLRLQSASLGGDSVAPATMICPVDEKGRLECRVPRIAGLDLRLRAPGFASRYFWSLDLSNAGSHDLGVVALRPGGSVVGYVSVPPGYRLEEVQARLTPITGSEQAGESDRVNRQAALEAIPDERGFFAFEGLTAGAYRLEVAHAALAAYELAPVRVNEGGQSEVAETIALVERVPLRLLLDPLFDAYGEDWRIEVLRVVGAGQPPRRTSDSAIVATAGMVMVPMAEATYEVRVLDSRGVRVATEEVVHGQGSASHLLEIRPIYLDGLVTLGDDPLIARIVFRGPSTIEMHSDVDGHFGGYLPRAGDWDVEIHAIEPPVRRRMRAIEVERENQDRRSTLHLRVPDTTLRATVVDEQGSLASGASVHLTDPLHSTRDVTFITDDDGETIVRGLDEGTVQAQAQRSRPDGEEESSSPANVELIEGRTAEVRLTLRPHVRLRGRLVAPDGNPLPNAAIETLPFSAAGVLEPLFAQPRATDAAGRFDVSLPRGTAAVHLTILAPGHPLTQRVVAAGEIGDITLGSASGLLTVHLPALVSEIPWNDPSVPRPGLVHASGAKLPLALLSRWSGAHGISWEKQDRAIGVPQLAPGLYGVCWFTAADWMVRDARGFGCATGELPADGTLSLRLTPPPE